MAQPNLTRPACLATARSTFDRWRFEGGEWLVKTPQCGAEKFFETDFAMHKLIREEFHSHRNIVATKDPSFLGEEGAKTYADAETCPLVTECLDTSLDAIDVDSLTLRHRAEIALDVARSLRFLHSNCVAHGAVVAEHILLHSPRFDEASDAYTAKLTSFSAAKRNCTDFQCDLSQFKVLISSVLFPEKVEDLSEYIRCVLCEDNALGSVEMVEYLKLAVNCYREWESFASAHGDSCTSVTESITSEDYDLYVQPLKNWEHYVNEYTAVDDRLDPELVSGALDIPYIAAETTFLGPHHLSEISFAVFKTSIRMLDMYANKIEPTLICSSFWSISSVRASDAFLKLLVDRAKSTECEFPVHLYEMLTEISVHGEAVVAVCQRAWQDFARSTDERRRKSAAYALMGLCSTHDNRSELVKHAVMTEVVHLLKQEAHTCNELAWQILCCLLRDSSENVKERVCAELVPRLTQTLELEGDRMRALSAWCIATIAANSSSLKPSDVEEPLLKSWRRGGNSMVYVQAMRALHYLHESDAARTMTVFTEDDMKKMVSMLKGSYREQKCAMSALVSASANEMYDGFLIAKIQTIAQLVSSKYAYIRTGALLLLCNMALSDRHADVHSSLRRAGFDLQEILKTAMAGNTSERKYATEFSEELEAWALEEQYSRHTGDVIPHVVDLEVGNGDVSIHSLSDEVLSNASDSDEDVPQL